MKLKRDTKFEEKLTCCLENDMRNFANFHQSTQKCQNWNFDKILLSKVENVWVLNLPWSYVSWQWRMIQKLKWNWVVTLKLTWTSQNLTWALEKSKILFLKLTLSDQSIYCLSYRSTEKLWKFWSKTDQWFEKRHEKFGKFSPEYLKVSKLELWWDPFVQSKKVMTL